MKIGRWIKRRLVEPSTAIALAIFTSIIGKDVEPGAIQLVFDSVTGVLLALGIIQPEGNGNNGE